jgi:flagellum-specific peptidoglycan hydrolase FlgJ
MKYILFIILAFSTYCIQAQHDVNAYIDKFDSLAVETRNMYGIPASVILGIALQESAAGTSKLCRVNHNHFGMKGRVASPKTKSGYRIGYRTFDTDEAAYLYFGEMISRKKYYTELKESMDYSRWLKAMKAAKYATSSHWIPRVENIIKRYDLTRYDALESDFGIPEPAISDSIPKIQN